MTPLRAQKKAIGAAAAGAATGVGAIYTLELPAGTPEWMRFVLVAVAAILPYLATFWTSNSQ